MIGNRGPLLLVAQLDDWVYARCAIQLLTFAAERGDPFFVQRVHRRYAAEAAFLTH